MTGIHADRLRAAYRHCRGVARHAENFPVAAFFLPRNVRDDLAAVYSFLRAADDIADEPGALSVAQRDAALVAWDVALAKAIVSPNGVESPILLACGETVRRRALPAALLHDLVRAFRTDLRTRDWPTLEALVRRYCRLSANPVGRLVLRLGGQGDASRDAWSDAICTGLQLANFWQDVAADARGGGGLPGRIYLPRAARRRHGVAREDLGLESATPGLCALVLELAGATERFFEAGAPLARSLSGRLGWQVALTLAGGRRVVYRLRAAKGDVIRGRVRLSARDVPAIFAGALAARFA